MDKNTMDERIAEYASAVKALWALDNAIRDDKVDAASVSAGTDAIVCHLQALHDHIIDAFVDTTPKT